MRPGGIRFTLDREVDLAEPGDGVEEFGVREANAGIRGAFGRYRNAHGAGNFAETQHPTAQAQSRRNGRSGLRTQRKVQRGSVQQ